MSALMPHSVSAAEITVQEIDEGACWARRNELDEWKIASFNDNASGVASAELIRLNLYSRVEEKLRSLGFQTYPERGLKIQLRCSSAGHEIHMNFAGGSLPFCVTTDLKLSRFELDANHEADEKSLCNRSLLRALIFIPKSAEETTPLVAALGETSLLEMIEKVEPQTGWIRVALQPQWALKENEVRAALLARANIQALTLGAFYDSRVSVAGTAIELGTASYPGY
jgi:hypothetical protein